MLMKIFDQNGFEDLKVELFPLSGPSMDVTYIPKSLRPWLGFSMILLNVVVLRDSSDG